MFLTFFSSFSPQRLLHLCYPPSTMLITHNAYLRLVSALITHCCNLVATHLEKSGNFTLIRDVRAVASIRIYFEGAKFLPSQGGGQSFGPMGRSPNGRELGGVLGEGAATSSHQVGGLGSAVSSPSFPGKFEIWCNLRPETSLQKCLVTCKLLQKG